MMLTLKHLTGPRNGFADKWTINTRQDYLDFQAHFLRLMRYPEPHPGLAILTVYINEGRLLVDCPCGGGVLVDHELELACCTSCGAIYEADQLVFPTKYDLTRLDDELGKRQSKHRNFDPRPPRNETADSIVREGMA